VKSARAARPEPAAFLTLSNGYRTDNFNFNIAGDINGKNPNILSELSWQNLKIYQISGRLTVDTDSLYARTSVGWGWIFSGTMQDSDYNGDNRTQEFSRSINQPGGNVMDTSVGVGYPFRLREDSVLIAPLVGYAYDRQQLEITNGNQTIPNSGPFAGLDSTYHAQWWGPWLGFDLAFAEDEHITWRGSFEYHWASYRATDNHNLRADLQHPESFVHTASGGGVTGSLGLDWALSEQWILALEADFISWSTRPGIDESFFSNGTVGTTRLNEVNWNSWAFALGIKRRFKLG